MEKVGEMSAEIIPFPSPFIMVDVYRIEITQYPQDQQDVDSFTVGWDDEGTISGHCLTGFAKQLPYEMRCKIAEFIANNLLEI